MAKRDKEEVIQPAKPVKPTIKVSIPETVPEHYFPVKPGHYHMIALRPDGTEKAGSDFNASPKLFENTYKPLTAQPEGTAVKPQFKVKKNP